MKIGLTMRILQSLVFLLCLALLSGFITEQGEDPADQIMADLYANLQDFRDISCEVAYEIRTPNRPPVTQNGYLRYQQGGRYHLQLEDQQICYNGDAQIIYYPFEQLAYITAFDPTRNASMVEAIFALFQLPSRKFLQETETLDGNKCYKVYMVMEGSRPPYAQAFVWIDAEGYFIRKVSFLTSSETLTAYTFQDVEFNKGLESGDFLLDLEKMTGVTVLDQR